MRNGNRPARRGFTRGLTGHQAPSLETRMGSNVTVQPSGCWAFRNDLTKYGTVNLGGGRANDRARPAHRWFYETLVGPIPDGAHLHHTCEHPGCVNPEHLEPMTPGDHQREHARLRRAV